MPRYAKFTVEKGNAAEFDTLVLNEWKITNNHETFPLLRRACQRYLDLNKKNEAAELTSQLLEAGEVIKMMQAKMVEKECQVKGMVVLERIRLYFAHLQLTNLERVGYDGLRFCEVRIPEHYTCKSSKFVGSDNDDFLEPDHDAEKYVEIEVEPIDK